MIFRLLLILLPGLFALPCLASAANGIKIGNASLSVTIEQPDTVSLEDAAIWIDTAPIFCDFFDNTTFKLQKCGNEFRGSIPLEMLEEIVGLRFECGGGGFGYMVTLYQEKPVELTFTIDAEYRFVACTNSDTAALTAEDWQRLSSIYMRFVAPEVVGVVPPQMYDSWEKVRHYENTVIYPKLLDYATEGEGIPENAPNWFVNSLKCRFASVDVIPYVKAAERIHSLAVDEPPMKSYAFLDSIDYSPVFLTRLPFTGLKSFLYALLRFPEGGFGVIGDTPVAEWQSAAREQMLPAISRPTRLLLDLLAAMSYVEQIDIRREPLTAMQIANIQAAFTDNDLDKIIIAKHARLVQSAKQPTRQDLSAVSFDIRRYIDKMYPGRPVIVHLWNTWCAPCLDAINRSEIIRRELPRSDIVFLFICDESSAADQWERRAADIDGVNLRISAEDAARIGRMYGLEGFPSYLVFDREHNLMHSQTSFPGQSGYRSWIESVTAIAPQQTGNH